MAGGQLYRLDEDGAARILSPLASATELTALGNGKVVFRGCRGYQTDCRAFATDGTATGTVLLEKVPDGSSTEGAHDFLAWQGHVYFLNTFGQAMSTDGTIGGTRTASTIQGDAIDLLAATAERLYYFSYESGYVSASIVILQDGFAHGPGAVLDGSLYFALAPSPEHSASGLWRSNGTLPGTALVANAPAVPWSSSPQPYPLGSGLVAEVGANFPSEHRLFTIEPSTLASQPVAEHPLEVLAAGRNKIFLADSGFIEAGFFGFDGDSLERLTLSDKNGRGLGFSDGTAAGTGWLDVPLTPDVFIGKNLVLADQRMVFPAIGDDAGNELWITDGSRAGTYRLTDLNPGPAAASPRSFAQVGDRLFFQATDGVVGFELWALDLPTPRPACPADRLCLQNDRFEVAVIAHAPDGDLKGRRALAADESGVFTFFSPNNWEMLVKVLDGCGLNDAFWVFASAASDLDYTLSVKDRADGRVRTYRGANHRGTPLLDIDGFDSCALAPPEAAHSPVLPPATAASRCADDPSSFCLGPGGRYRVGVEWTTADDSGPGLPVPDGSADSGLFTFFSASNWELMVKLLDGCAINGKRWVYAAGTTEVGWRLTFSDRQSPATKVYRNPLGTPAKTVTDGAAFDCN